ncbi:MAG: CpsD/CapB family tyrosine-protein kinase, partial [Firmicutes bacterium]|nr:CpsD/CapB family tyrosine-protein kinase [Bacillota bacterium]
MRRRRHEYERHLITDLEPKSPLAEAFRVLRTNIQFAAVDRPIRSLLITSAGPAEGKSTTLANLGVARAQSGARVIVLDADLRRPTQHKLFNLSRGAGVSSVVLGRARVEEALQETGIPGLRLLSSGPIPPNPSELLASQAFSSLLKELKEKTDYLLIDSPPVMAVADASIVAGQVDGVLLVIQLGMVARPMAVRAKEQLLAAKANLLGMVLTNAGMDRDYSYYY